MTPPRLKLLNDQTPNQIATNSDGMTDRVINARIMAMSGGRMDIQAGILWILSWWIEVSSSSKSKVIWPPSDMDRLSNAMWSELMSVGLYRDPLQDRRYELLVSNSPEKVMEKSIPCRIIFGTCSLETLWPCRNWKKNRKVAIRPIKAIFAAIELWGCFLYSSSGEYPRLWLGGK